MSTLNLDAQALYAEMLAAVRALWRPGMQVLGIWSGGAWLAERLHADLGLPGKPGVITSALHRDDFSARGFGHGKDATKIPFEVDGAHILLIDDVLFTGRTIRAVLNELFDFGRPARVELAVLVDRGGRELPVAARYCAHTLAAPLAREQNLELQRDAAGQFGLELTQRA